MGLALMTARMMQQVFQLSFSDQLVQVIPEIPAILHGVSVVLVVLAIKVLVSLCRLSRHLIRPSKVWFALDFFPTPDAPVLRIQPRRFVHWLSPIALRNLSSGDC